MLRAASANSSGVTKLKSLAAAVTGIAAVETIVAQVQLAAGQWQTNGVIRVRVTGNKNGAVDSGNLWVRVGTAGTVADTAITGLDTLAVMGASTRSGGWEFEIKLESATSAVKLGNQSSTTGTYQGASTAVQSASTVISSAATNALWVSMSFASSGATNTLNITSAQIDLISP